MHNGLMYQKGAFKAVLLVGRYMFWNGLIDNAFETVDLSEIYITENMEYVENIADKIGEITVSGNGNMVKQLKEIFSVNK